MILKRLRSSFSIITKEFQENFLIEYTKGNFLDSINSTRIRNYFYTSTPFLNYQISSPFHDFSKFCMHIVSRLFDFECKLCFRKRPVLIYQSFSIIHSVTLLRFSSLINISHILNQNQRIYIEHIPMDTKPYHKGGRLRFQDQNNGDDQIQPSNTSSASQLATIVSLVSKRIDESELEWKNLHFANFQQTRNEENLQVEYGQWLEKYRGKQGEIKSIGLILYFSFLRFMMVLFTVLTIAALPHFIINFQGNGLTEYSNVQIISLKLLTFSLANQRKYLYDTLGTEEIQKITFNKDIIIWNDIFCILLGSIAIMWWRIKSHRILGQYIVKCPAPWLYTLEVTDLPKNITIQKLYNHFSYFGKVRQIEPIRNHQGNLIMMKSLVNLIHRYKNTEPNSKNQKQLKESISSVYSELAQNYLSKVIPSIKSVFIAFDSIEVRNRTEYLYRYQINPQRLYIDYKFPTVKKCNIEPLTINWQNYHLKNNYHTKKNICQCMLLTMMLTVIVFALFILNLSLNRVHTAVTKYSSVSMDSFEYLGMDEQTVNRFCASLTLLKFKWSYYSVCSSYFNNYKNQFMLMVAFSLLVVVINLLTNRILRELVEFRRYKTIAEKNRFLITAIFFFSLINSGILVILVRSKYIGPALSWIVGKIFSFPEEFLKVEIFEEFNRQWYLNVGKQLIFNFVITLILCPYLYILKYWLKQLFRKKNIQNGDKRSNQPDFDYCTFYAMSLKAIFFCLFYSQAMPILYPLAIGSIIVQYTLSSCLLKYFVRQPMFFDAIANQTVIRILPYGFLIHTFLSIMFFNVDDIFPNKSSYAHTNTSIDSIFNKFKQGYIHCFVFVILLIYTLYRQQIYKFVFEYTQQFLPSYSKTFKQIARNPSFLSSYRMKDNPKYKIISYALDLFEKHMRNVSLQCPNSQANFLKQTKPCDFELPKSMQSMTNIFNEKQNVIC